jgi:hypothetical protein
MITKPRGKILRIGDPDLNMNNLVFIISPQAKRWIACMLCDYYRNTITTSEARAQTASNSSGRICRGPSSTTWNQNYSLGGQNPVGLGIWSTPKQKRVVFFPYSYSRKQLKNACDVQYSLAVIVYRIFLCWGTFVLGILCFHFGTCLNLRVMN